MDKPCIKFEYDDRGRGDIEVHWDSGMLKYSARTGYISTNGKLRESCPEGTWYMMTKSVDTSEIAMIPKGKEKGWKTRMFNRFRKFTHYLIHPDGNKPGSLGCLVTPDMAEILRFTIDVLLSDYKEIPLYVKKVEG